MFIKNFRKELLFQQVECKEEKERIYTTSYLAKCRKFVNEVNKKSASSLDKWETLFAKNYYPVLFNFLLLLIIHDIYNKFPKTYMIPIINRIITLFKNYLISF